MNSTELIAQADRRYEEMRGESRGWVQGSWCSGYINGWMDHHGEGYRAGVKRRADALEYVREMITQLPGGIDEDADETDVSPSDMVAHIGGLIYRKVDAILNAEVRK